MTLSGRVIKWRLSIFISKIRICSILGSISNSFRSTKARQIKDNVLIKLVNEIHIGPFLIFIYPSHADIASYFCNLDRYQSYKPEKLLTINRLDQFALLTLAHRILLSCLPIESNLIAQLL